MVRYADVCRRTLTNILEWPSAYSRQERRAKLVEILPEALPAEIDSLLSVRRIRRPEGTPALPLRSFYERTHPGRIRKHGQKDMAARSRLGLRTKQGPCSLCDQIHSQEHDIAESMLGWDCTRVLAYEQKARARAYGRSRDGSIPIGMQEYRRLFPFARSYWFTEHDYSLWLHQVSKETLSDGPVDEETIRKGHGRLEKYYLTLLRSKHDEQLRHELEQRYASHSAKAARLQSKRNQLR